MNIRQLQYFCSAVARGSFSRAAAEQGVSVQAISKSISELEREVGESLFVRSGEGVEPTELGWDLAARAERAIASYREVSRAADAFRAGHAREAELELGIAVPRFRKSDSVCRALASFLSAHVDTAVRLRTFAGQDALDRLREGSLDGLVTIGRFLEPGFDCAVMGTLSTGVFIARRHPLAGRKTVTLADLAAYPVVFAERADRFNETILNIYRRRGLASPLVKPRSGEELTVCLEREHAYLFGVGISAFRVVPDTVMRPLDPADAAPVPVCMVTLAARENPLTARTATFVQERFPQLQRIL